MMLARRTARTLGLTLTAAAALTFGGALPAQASPNIPLNTGQEAPRPTGAGGAHGMMQWDVDEGSSSFCFDLDVSGLSSPAVAAHIHIGGRNAPGPVVLPLDVPNDTEFSIGECVVADPALLAAIHADPSAYYINVHTAVNPRGEIRGQLK
ncbi:MAG: CHRD domain-containing protein [Microbacterium sp.]